MNLSKREKWLAVTVLCILAVLVFDQLLLTPYLDRRARLEAEKQDLLEELQRARRLFSQCKQLGVKWQNMLAAGLRNDPATTESAVLNALREWSQESGLTLTSLRPERSVQHGELREIIIQAAGVGGMSAVSRFLWHIETTSLPVRMGDLQLGARKEGTDDLALQVRVSALCLAPAPAAAAKIRVSTSPNAQEEDKP